MAATIELAQTGKRDWLQSLEKQYQQKWKEDRIFEVEAPSPEELKGLSPAEVKEKLPKWFGNFAFPYMNGSLHLGHAFTMSKVEFAAGYERMLGKRVLYPLGFHATGMPIKSASDKVIREMEMFGENFERFDDETGGLKEEKDASQSQQVGKATKGKLAAKSTGHKYQFQIMESIGIPRTDIKKFADPYYWLEFFPPICVKDNDAFGSRIDWRRAFITTDANPYFDSFVRWQTNKLHALGKIKFGERYTIYSPKDGQPCMDHDRSEGEALGPQEYTGIKLEVREWSEAAKKLVEGKLGGRKVSMVAATLRPETMYGQTNCFVGTAIKYGVFVVNDQEAFLCTYRAARNMAFQGLLSGRGEIQQILEIDGTDLVGTKVSAPFSVNPEVYVLPMDNVLPTKGTGVVTSVPSDSPDDYQTLMDLRKKAEFYKIDPKWAAFEPVAVLSTPTYGEMTAPALVQKLKIQSQKDTKQLAEAKEISYKEGFYSGTMVIGEFKGLSVQDAKQKVRDSMIAKGAAFAYAEPEGLVISRSTDECVVALMDQWYLDYGEASWRAETEKLVAKMEMYTTETRNAFEATLAWLNQWACARTYGLGSKLPWDPQFLVESLSDSTVYQAYYPFAHLLHKDYFGREIGPLGITPDQLTDEVWEYIFRDGPWPDPAPLPKEKVDKMKHEYNYFYPFDLRSSGKDLVPNHLTFCLYNHVALFPEEKWPLSMRTNGHLMLNGKKMSKSTGNSLTLKESVEKFGADATRLALADAGDSVEDANFDEKTANAQILRIHTLLSWCEDMLKPEAKLRTGPKNSYHDRVFEEEINDLLSTTKGHYGHMHYKDALKYGYYEFQSARDWYREVTADIGMHADLVKYWIRTAALLVAPIAPHLAEHIWTGILKEAKSVQLARWPEPSKPVDKTIVETGAYMRTTVKTIRDAETNLLKKIQKGKKGKGGEDAPFDPKKPKSVHVYVATKFPEWQDACVQAVKDAYDEKANKVDDAKVREILAQKGLIKDKRAMPFIQLFKKRMAEFGAQTAFRRGLPFSESEVLTQFLPYLKKSLNLVGADVMFVDEALAREGPGYSKAIIETSEPGAPAFEYYNV
ncbi:leucine-tRNA ligase [Coniophora puteana RWD-64-598 SS2]|uniref:leucine--tRNA ligase n=1 Tax=Coniophora puteana (strain RWD-64-598) TaxID=741705 RepID=A0A5M3MBS2_CONPW|nr:leucine-tRNA ligase [Coniophora puteana RWD-64-598 SS2]EIW76689.1 leucine-tRNA ligase [Coniophora puteana RWD-64-598 SS2]